MYRWEVPKVLARRMARIRARTGVVARQLCRAVDEYLNRHDAPPRPARRGPSRSPPPEEEAVRHEQRQPRPDPGSPHPEPAAKESAGRGDGVRRDVGAEPLVAGHQKRLAPRGY